MLPAGSCSPGSTSSSSVAAPVLRLQHKCPLHAFQMHGDRLVSGEWDGSINVWELRMGASLARFEGQGLGHAERVWAVAMDQYRAVTGGLDHKLQVLSFV
jgi:WD40 repeat protein